MSETPSSMLELGTRLPSVRLVNATDGAEVDVDALAKGTKGLLVLFICNHCPYVVHLRSELVRAAHDALDRGLAVVAINSIDAHQRLAYRGQFDDSRPSNGKPVTGKDLRAAIDAVAEGRAPSPDQRPSVGCNIKWRKGR
jgi:hypothetical protein